ncbi:MAG: hypothetical protein HQL31_11540 [Planctomycetes bacterium]|nr:hypothetical protein [Planctomycetota bacterium]
MSRIVYGLILWIALSGITFPAYAKTSVYIPPSSPEVSPNSTTEDLLRRFAPVWLAPETEASFNRIGKPELYRGWLGCTKARVNPDQAALYAEVRADNIGSEPVLQLVYRIHFEKIPLRLSRYFFEAHRNPGLLVIVTLDSTSYKPIFVTATPTCGCYRIVLPTDHFDRPKVPEDWPEEIGLYGQHLPGILRIPENNGSRLIVSLAPASHRIVDLSFSDELPEGSPIKLPVVALDTLRHLPIAGDTKGREGSLFYSSGPLRGHVRGAWNPMEGLTLFGLISLDPTVGMDKDFGDPKLTGTPFYTSLPFWKHSRSRLDRFNSILVDLGFRLKVSNTEIR